MNMQFTCLDLLPQSCSTVLRDSKMIISILNLLDFILEELIQSQITFYQEKKYHLFDPHVGENCCQIRAAQLLLYATYPLQSLMEIQNHINSLQNKKLRVNNIIQYFMEHHEPNHSLTLIEFLKKHELIFLVSIPDKIVFFCYFLTKFKERKYLNHDTMDYAKIANKAKISIKLAKKIARYYQIALAEYSCDQIIAWADELGFTFQYVDMLKTMIRRDDDDRTVLPCYFLTEVIIAKLKSERLPILVVLEDTHHTGVPKLLYFYFNETANAYRFSDDITESTELSACFVIRAETEHALTDLHAVRNIANLIEERSLSKIILNYMAAHPQYSGKNLAAWKEDPFQSLTISPVYYPVFQRRIMAAKQAGIKTGCYIGNRAFFFIQHIFLDSLQHQLSEIRNASPSHFFRENLTCWEALEYVL